MTLKLDRTVLRFYVPRSMVLIALLPGSVLASPDGREFLSIEDCALRECDGMCFMSHPDRHDIMI